MPSTTQEKPAKKTFVSPEADGAKPRKTKSKNRAAAKKVATDDELATDPEPKPKAKKRSRKSEGAESEDQAAGDDGDPSSDRGSKSVSGSAKRTAAKGAKKIADSSDDEPATKPAAKSRKPVDLARAVLRALATNERMNQFLLENLDDRTWTAPPPSGQGRPIAAIVSHVHNVRHMWLVGIAKGTSIPDKLDRATVTKPAAMKALAKSHEALLAAFERALENGGHVKVFRPDVVGFLGYVIAHEAHHRGQISMLARELGRPISKETNFGMWDWNTRGKETKFKR